MNVLLHTCCANCAIYPVDRLRDAGHEVTGYFYNPNIHPYLEFRRRLDTLKEYAELRDLTVLYREDYQLAEFLGAVAADPANRCGYCYQVRLAETAKVAAEQGYDGFTSTLLYSRFQKHDEIRLAGEDLARRYGLTFLYEDYRKGWNLGVSESKRLGLYRQQYCGCIYSEYDRYAPRPGK